MNEFELKLFVMGDTNRSRRAITNLQAVCEQHLSGRYTLQIIDVLEQPADAEANRIMATPTLVKTSPAPTGRIIGDMSMTAKVLAGLGIMAPAENGANQ